MGAFGDMFQGGMMQNHTGPGFGQGIQGGVDQMWRVNQANQQRSAMGGGRPQQQPAWQPPQPGSREYWDYQRDRNAQQEIDNNFQRTQRQLDRDSGYQNQRQENTDSAFQANNNRAFGFLGSMFGQGSPYGGGAGPQPLPTQFNTNYGAYGSVSNPQQVPGNGSQWPMTPFPGINY